MELLFTPLNNWSWVQGAGVTYANLKENNGATLGEDLNNTLSFASSQLKANAGGAVLTIAGFGVGAAILKYFGM